MNENFLSKKLEERKQANALRSLIVSESKIDNFDERPILYPTVPKNSERLRIVLHSYNSLAEAGQLINLLNQ